MLNTCKRFDADVVICGGGCAGFTAGVAAARAGNTKLDFGNSILRQYSAYIKK